MNALNVNRKRALVRLMKRLERRGINVTYSHLNESNGDVAAFLKKFDAIQRRTAKSNLIL